MGKLDFRRVRAKLWPPLGPSLPGICLVSHRMQERHNRAMLREKSGTLPPPARCQPRESCPTSTEGFGIRWNPAVRHLRNHTWVLPPLIPSWPVPQFPLAGDDALDVPSPSPRSLMSWGRAAPRKIMSSGCGLAEHPGGAFLLPRWVQIPPRMPAASPGWSPLPGSPGCSPSAPAILLNPSRVGPPGD